MTDDTSADEHVITDEDVLRAMREGSFDKALSGIMALAVKRALDELAQHNVHFFEGPGFHEVGVAQLTYQAAVAARHEVELREDSADRERLDAAADVLEAVAVLRTRLDDGFRRGKDLDNVLGELIFLGALLGQADVVLNGFREGIWQDAAKARRAREGRRANQARQAAFQSSWNTPALELATRLCHEKPHITSDQLAEAIRADKSIPTPSHEQVLKWVRKQRKESGPIPKRRKR